MYSIITVHIQYGGCLMGHHYRNNWQNAIILQVKDVTMGNPFTHLCSPLNGYLWVHDKVFISFLLLYIIVSNVLLYTPFSSTHVWVRAHCQVNCRIHKLDNMFVIPLYFSWGNYHCDLNVCIHHQCQRYYISPGWCTKGMVSWGRLLFLFTKDGLLTVFLFLNQYNKYMLDIIAKHEKA